jgi:ribosomal-protein-alanine N-acetyltransferase
MQIPTLETPRLILRPHTLHDVEPSYQMMLDPEVGRYTGDGGSISLDEMRQRIKKHVLGDYEKHGFGRFAVELKATGKFIGFAGLKYLSHIDEVDIGYRFVRDQWGKGIATEAVNACLPYGFETLGLKRIIGLVMPANTASIRVLEKTGFQFEEERIEYDEWVRVYTLIRD